MADSIKGQGEEENDDFLENFDEDLTYAEMLEKGNFQKMPSQNPKGKSQEDVDAENQLMETPPGFDELGKEIEDDGDPKNKGNKSDADDKGVKSKPDEHNKSSNGKFANQEEAEKAHAEAEKNMHKATRAAAVSKKLLDDANSKIAELSGKKVNHQSDDDSLEVINKWFAEEMGKIPAFDPEKPETVVKYNQAIGSLIAKQTKKITAIERENTKAHQSRGTKVSKYIDAKLEEVGLSDYRDMFYSLSASVPKNITNLEDGVAWGIDQIKAVQKQMRASVEKEFADKMGDQTFQPKGKRTTPGKKAKGKAKADDENEDVDISLAEMIEDGRYDGAHRFKG